MRDHLPREPTLRRPVQPPRRPMLPPRGHLAKATSTATESGRPSATHAASRSTAGDEANGKLTATRAPLASRRNPAASAPSTASGFSQNTARPAANAARACPRCVARRGRHVHAIRRRDHGIRRPAPRHPVPAAGHGGRIRVPDA